MILVGDALGVKAEGPAELAMLATSTAAGIAASAASHKRAIAAHRRALRDANQALTDLAAFAAAAGVTMTIQGGIEGDDSAHNHRAGFGRQRAGRAAS